MSRTQRIAQATVQAVAVLVVFTAPLWAALLIGDPS